MHKLLAYFSVLAAGGAIATGIYHFRTNDKLTDVKVEWIVVPIHCCILIGLEVLYWVMTCLKHEKQLGEVQVNTAIESSRDSHVTIAEGTAIRKMDANTFVEKTVDIDDEITFQ